MPSLLLSAILLFPTFSAIDPISPTRPMESHLLEDSFPPAIFYFAGVSTFAALSMALYLRK